MFQLNIVLVFNTPSLFKAVVNDEKVQLQSEFSCLNLETNRAVVHVYLGAAIPIII